MSTFASYFVRCWKRRFLFLSLWAATVAALPAATPREATAEVFDEEMSGYKHTAASGAVAQLVERLARGQADLKYDARHGWLPGLLREFGVLESSQVLVASKTSPNRHLISPKNPRALYFNDRVALAYVPSAPLIELAAADPKLGVVFYTVEQKAAARPSLTRDDRCLECHASSKTLNVPGLLVRSFLTEDDGDVDLLSGKLVNHRTPLAERWGGYYVTGTHGAQTHLGNLFGSEARARHAQNLASNGNVTDLRPWLEVAKFPSPDSDIVALLVLDHQLHMQNWLARLAYEAGAAIRSGDSLRPAHGAVEATLKYMLFAEEAPLRAAVRGTSDFAASFERQGPRDAQGRSLRRFDLQTRLFAFPCSYMIYSPEFDALPDGAKKRLLRRLWEILSGEDKTPDYAHLSAETRRAILEILRATKPSLPAYWRL